MNKQEHILMNPFHPLDLSPSDLLTIYKRFQEYSTINRNSKQQLPIENISQLISGLRKCKPSEVQQCLNEAFIKSSISWNDFLMFLDQQSETRSKILSWIIHEKSSIKYQYAKSHPIKKQLKNKYEDITFIQNIKFSSQTIMIIVLDGKKILLANPNQQLSIIHCYTRCNSKSIVNLQPNNDKLHEKLMWNVSKARKQSTAQKIMNKSELQGMQTQNNTFISAIKQSDSADQAYYIKQRKNINAMFNLFRDLPIEGSIKVARAASQKIRQKNISQTVVNQLKDSVSDIPIDRNQVATTKAILSLQKPKPIDVATNKLKSLYEEKSHLTYNPYFIKKNNRKQQQSYSGYNPKRIVFQRKQKQYLQEAIFQVFEPQLNCLAVIYYNMQIVLLKVANEYKKVVLEQQDTISINTQKNHNRNQTAQAISFYYHSIINKWMILILIRCQFKKQYKNQSESIVKGYQIEFKQTKRKNGPIYKFLEKHKLQGTQSFIIRIQDHELISMVTQVKFGIHLMSHDGKYLCYREQSNYGQNQISYWKLQHQQKFRYSKLTFSCLQVNSQINKIVFGTLNGNILIYDTFSHQSKLTKVTNAQIVQLRVKDKYTYILTHDQKLIIYDLDRLEQIQLLSVKNQQKLHQKVRRFELYRSKLFCYGTEIKEYHQFVDQSLLHEDRKINSMYTWRVNKVKQKVLKKESKQQYKLGDNCQLIIDSKSYFIILSEILQAIVISKENLKVKFTLVLDIPYDSKVLEMTLSEDQKLLCLLLVNQNLYIFNIYTQEKYAFIKSDILNKFSSVTFLDNKNQYMLAVGTDTGKIALVPYPSIPEKPHKYIVYHKKCVCLIKVLKNCMMSVSEDGFIGIWTLPFNVLRYQIQTAPSVLYESIGQFQNYWYIKTIVDGAYEINVSDGTIKMIISEKEKVSPMAIDKCTNCIICLNQKLEIQVWEKNKEKNAWESKKKLKNPNGYKIISIGIVPSEKAVLFLKGSEFSTWHYQNPSFSKISNFHN